MQVEGPYRDGEAATRNMPLIAGGVDGAGNVQALLVNTDGSLETGAFVAASNASTVAYAASKVVKASAGTLYGLTGYNAKTSAQFVQLHDAASLPANTAVPVVTFTVPASSNFALDYGAKGRAFATGIVVGNSSTGPTLTTGAADLWVDAQYS